MPPSTVLPFTVLPYPLRDDGPAPYRLLRAGRRQLVERHRAALADPRAAQEARLRAILARVAPGAWGRAHDLGRVRTLADLRRAVPVQTHAALRPWLDRVEAGEPGVLGTEPVQMLVETSGTSGRPKRLPVTASWARAVEDAQALWLLGLVRERPGVARGRALTLTSAARHATTAGGLPVGANTGRMQAAQPWIVRRRYPVPPEVALLPGADQRLYATLRFALPVPVTSLTTANPSTLLLLAGRLEEWRDPLSRDLAAGTLRHGPAADLAPASRRPLERRLRRHRPPEGPWTPSALWPLQAACCWVDGPAVFFADRLRALLGPAVPVHPLPVAASEGTFAVPLSGSWPGGVLDVGGPVLELVDEAGEARWPWEVAPGERLRLVVTTAAGLVRYDMADLVEVVGRCEETPVVRFVGKAGRFLNTVGERVSEEQLSLAAAAAGRRAGVDPVGLTVRARLALVPAYEVAAEGLPAQARAAWLDAFDRALSEANVEHASRRASGRLGPPALRALAPGSYARWRAARLAAGAPEAQLKEPLMACDEAEWVAVVGEERP